MRILRNRVTVLVAAAIAWKLVACSPGSGNGDNGGIPVNGGGAGNMMGGGTGAVGAGNSTNYNAGGDGLTNFNTGGSDPNGGGGLGGGCPEITAKPEQIITYRDATVTDTIYTYSPVALYIMQDRSGSMITGFPEGSAQSWGDSSTAIGQFLSDPASQTLDVGLAFFPTVPGPNGYKCSDGSGSGNDCGVPQVEIGPVSTNAGAINAAMSNNAPNPLNFTPTECALMGMISHCTQWMQANAAKKEPCVAVLITDGNPTLCDSNQANLAKIVSDGKAAGVTTFTLGMVGSNKAFLDALAQAGGTNASIDVTGGSAAIIAALNTIRQSVASQSVSHISIPTTISTPLPCEWKIPPAPLDAHGQSTFNKDNVNVKFTPQGAPAQDFGYVNSQAECAGVSNGWYYDDANTPTKVILCSGTCDTVKASVGAQVDLAFGCARKPAIPK